MCSFSVLLALSRLAGLTERGAVEPVKCFIQNTDGTEIPSIYKLMTYLSVKVVQSCTTQVQEYRTLRTVPSFLPG